MNRSTELLLCLMGAGFGLAVQSDGDSLDSRIDRHASRQIAV